MGILATQGAHAHQAGSTRWMPWLAGAGLLMGALAWDNVRRTRKAERRNPPRGRFLDIDGVHLHFIERGEGRPVLFLHGNGSMVEDFEASGLMDLAARQYRAIAFDRPGFGHSSRPRGTAWTPTRQAALLNRALGQLGIEHAIVVGHSWGTMVALALALNHPHRVGGLVLVSGYYFAAPRMDAMLVSPPALPVVGDVMRFTISPLMARAMQPAILRKLFGPAPVPRRFARFPLSMAYRPSQIRAASAEAAMMPSAAAGLEGRYREVSQPAVILAGQGDRLVDPERQSVHLHEMLPDSELRLAPRLGHMLHQNAPGLVMEAIHRLARPDAPPAPVH